MLDQFAGRASSLDGPARHGFTVTPTDGADLSEITRALYIGGSGTVALTLESGATVTFSGLAAGTILPVRVRQVAATGTTATDLLGLV